ncbi:MAG: hypothetical protein JOY54_13685 [Acidobacteriaceae bacterium]|nr:hypothetical protein [Acidobacteriaceae bacterium]
MQTKTDSALVAVFRDLSEAHAAARELTSHAFAEDHIHLAADPNRSNPCTNTAARYPGSGYYQQDFDHWLEAMFPWGTETGHQHYETAVRDGKALLGLSTPEQMLDRAADILCRHSPIDVRREDFGASIIRFVTG